MQTDQPASSSNSLPEPSTSTHTIGGSPPVPRGYESGSEAEVEQPSTSTSTPRRGLRSCQQPDRYTAVRSISDGCQTASCWTPSTLLLVGQFLAVTLAPQLDTTVAIILLLPTMVGLCNNGMLPLSHQVQVPPPNLGTPLLKITVEDY